MADSNQNAKEGDIVGFTKPRKFLWFKLKAQPIYQGNKQAKGQTAAPSTTQPASPSTTQGVQQPAQKGSQKGSAPAEAKPKKYTGYQIYLNNVIAKHKGLDLLLKSQGIDGGPQKFVQRMMTNAIIISVVVAVTMILLFNTLLASTAQPLIVALIIGVAIGFACYNFTFRQFLNFPYAKIKSEGKQVEGGILFAARDMIISLRSGIPLFNAMTSISSGYGAASKEFSKIISLIQLGMPMDQAIDDVSARSTSKTFKRIMLQASVSIREGADVVQALEEVVEQVMQERIIELRRYGQRLNALSMFYMLFGIIFPSMGVAVLTILTTFINIFTVNNDFLILILVFIGILQLIFLNLMRSSRPVFSI